MPNKERLQKVMAAAGIASRRASEDLIRQGRVQVNGRVVVEQGVKVDPAVDDIRVNGALLSKTTPLTYILLHKPDGVLSTAQDELGRKTVLDLVPSSTRLYPVGRLDADSEGLILLTNDGELTNHLTHPRYGQTREYRALVHGHPNESSLQRMRRGLVLEDGPTGQAVAEVVGPAGCRREKLPPPSRGLTWLKIIVREGRKRQVRRMCEIIGHPAVRLVRIGMGTLRLGNLPAGKFRVLSSTEVEQLRTLARPGKKKASKKRRRSWSAPRFPPKRETSDSEGPSQPRSKSRSGEAPKSKKSQQSSTGSKK